MPAPEDQTEVELEKTRRVVAAAVAEQAAASEALLPTTEPEYVDPWADFTVEDLREVLRGEELAVSGNRDELIARLTDAGIEAG
jgi:hypothetical protein